LQCPPFQFHIRRRSREAQVRNAPELWKRYRPISLPRGVARITLISDALQFDENSSLDGARGQRASAIWTRSESGAIAEYGRKNACGHYGCAPSNRAHQGNRAGNALGTWNRLKNSPTGRARGKSSRLPRRDSTQVLAIGIGGALGPMFVGDAPGNPAADRHEHHFIDKHRSRRYRAHASKN